MKVVVLDSLFDDLDVETEAAAAEGATVERWSGEKSDLAEATVVAHVRTQVDAAMIASLESCRVIARFGTGIETVDLGAAEAAGIAVVTVRDYCIPELCSQTLGLAFALTRRLQETSRNADDRWQTIAVEAPLARYDKVAVIGMGSIGARVAAALKVLDHDVVAVSGSSERAEAVGVPVVPLDEALAFADLVTLHCALDESTRHLIDEERLAVMRPTAVLVDTARLGLLDEAAVAHALEDRRLAGVALDGHLAPDSPLRRLSDDPRLLVTPHLGWYSSDSATELRRATIRDALVRASATDVPRPHDSEVSKR
jgi:D-3-phosphoglycerate dehydrogenase